MWPILWRVFGVSSVLALGGKLEEWFGKEPAPTSGTSADSVGTSIKRFTILFVIAAIVYAVFRLMGKKIIISKSK